MNMQLEGGQHRDERVRISRRNLILGATNALAVGSGGFLFAMSTAFAAGPAGGGNQDDRPFSKDAKIIMWGESPDGTQPNGQSATIAVKRLCLEGDWCDTEISVAVAWGERDTHEVWTSNPNLVPGKYALRFSPIQRDLNWPGRFYVDLSFDLADSKSRQIAAMFRYVRNHRYDGVFVAAFPFPRGEQ
jgi:hypothetical protein